MKTEALKKQYWTSGVFQPNTKIYAWFVVKGVYPNFTMDVDSRPFNYTNWASEYPTKVGTNNNGTSVLLNCQQKSCKWQNIDSNYQAGVMCEAPLDSAYKHSNVTRKAKVKQYKRSETSDYHQKVPSAGLVILYSKLISDIITTC